jgi:hypothetical protein
VYALYIYGRLLSLFLSFFLCLFHSFMTAGRVFNFFTCFIFIFLRKFQLKFYRYDLQVRGFWTGAINVRASGLPVLCVGIIRLKSAPFGLTTRGTAREHECLNLGSIVASPDWEISQEAPYTIDIQNFSSQKIKHQRPKLSPWNRNENITLNVFEDQKMAIFVTPPVTIWKYTYLKFVQRFKPKWLLYLASCFHSFCSLSYDRSVASSKASSPQGAI